ncbi:hypothetical protein [Bradyrhizobium pachyrhizi]|uniref:hypothetical protein n=1 Tax=Bradyrhizobium pachyrhizi TaxID=280333 RepID=UPI001428A788|nr:hypothetical protein [Bradyrhizobium pachyrhizi]
MAAKGASRFETQPMIGAAAWGSARACCLQAIGTLEISRKGCRAHSPREQAFVGYLLRRMSALRLNARNLTLRGATKCLLSLPNFLRHAICSVYGIITIAVRWSSGRTPRRCSRLARPTTMTWRSVVDRENAGKCWTRSRVLVLVATTIALVARGATKAADLELSQE